MKTFAAIILSLSTLLPYGFGQQEEVGLSGSSFSISAEFYQTSSTALFQDQKQGLFFKDSVLYLGSPMAELNINGLKTTLEMDSTASYFTISKTIDGRPIGIPTVVHIDDYVQLSLDDRKNNLFKKVATGRLQAEEDAAASQSLELIGADIAGQRVSLRVRGNVNITGKLRQEDRSKQTNTNNTNQSNTFQIEQKQAFKIEGKIGDRISIQVDQDSERDFDFENNMEIYYNGTEDEIIQRVEAGNISLNLPGTKLAMFSGQNNGLFGLKALAKIGPVDITSIASLERGRKEKLSFNNGSSEASEIVIQDYNRRRNVYFYVNHYYRRKSYPLDPATGQHYRSGRRIQTLRVYKYTNFNQADEITHFAKIYDKPESGEPPTTSHQVIQLVQGNDEDYVLFEEQGVIRMNSPVMSNEILAIAYVDTFYLDETKNQENLRVFEYDPELSDQRTYQEGNDIALGTPGIADTLELKLIKPDNALPGEPSWDLEWKNVFYLGTSGINEDGFDLKLIQSIGGEDQEEAVDGTPFLQLFDLDVRGVGDLEEPDGIMDLNNVDILNLSRGELIIPYLNPFLADTLVEGQDPLLWTNAIGDTLGNGGNPNLVNYPEYSSRSFYENSPSSSDYNVDSKFQMRVSYANQSSNFSLGFNVIEGSEEVTLNGVRLERGASKDYTIDYFTGQLVITNEAAVAPGANLEIKYELNEFFQLDKKVILGSRAEIKFGENKNSFVGLSAIYFSKSSIDEKVRVGKEPMENFIWDLNTKVTQDLPWLTRGLDWLPVIKTDAKSNLTVSGEIAQVIPNPNTSVNEELGDFGVAYVDDFEGSRRESQLSIIRGSWGLASIPINTGGIGALKSNKNRAFTHWYNPFNRVLTKSIWPNKETSSQAQNDVTDILVLNVEPAEAFSVRDFGENPDEAWGGVMRALSSGYYDQSESKFMELWVKGNTGRLHIDLGYISEDQQDEGDEWQVTILDETVTKGYGHLDTEDIKQGVRQDGYVEEAEDLGIDGLVNTTLEDIETYGYHHPSWDLYAFDSNPSNDSIDYSHINGTEGNIDFEGGSIPNTEDLDNDGSLDTRNAYFTIDVDLTSSEYVAGRTRYSDNSETGWKLISIPLADFIPTGDNPDLAQWSQIKYSRIWLDEMPVEGGNLQIATVNIVGNEWQEQGVFSQYAGTEVVVNDSLHGTINVMVINTEDNPSRYNSDGAPGSYAAPPPGVRGILDPITQLRSKEQSLVIRADELSPGHTVVADKLFRGSVAKDFVHYKTMKMFVHGWDKTRASGTYEDGFSVYEWEDRSDLEFFFRFGETETDFYEIRKPIYSGWDERNHLDINLADLANFKLALDDSVFIVRRDLKSTIPMPPEISEGLDSTVIDTFYWADLPTEFKYASMDLPDGSTIAIRGKPALTRVKLLKTGFTNLSDQRMTGEIWIDEFRLSDVEKNTATAYRANLSMQFADVGRISMDIQKDDADFHNVQQQFGTGDNSLATNINGSVSLHKFIPETWGLNIPLSMSYRKSEKQPKYITGSDIRIVDLDPSLRDTIETMIKRSEVTTWNMSLSKKVKSEHWLPKYTIDNFNFKVGSSNSVSSDAKKKEQKQEKLDGSLSYKVNLGNDFTVAPLGFLESLPLIGESLAETEFAYLPTNIGFDGSMVESKNSSVARNPNATPFPSNHQLAMTRRFNIDWNPLSTVSAKFSSNMSNNLDSLKNRKEDIIRNADFGHLGNYKETYNLSWNPKTLKLFSPSFSYSSNFSAIDEIRKELPGLNVGVSSNASANMSLTVSEVFGLIHTPANAKKSSKKTQSPQARRGRGRGTPQEEQKDPAAEADTDASESGFSFGKILDFTFETLDRIDPISMSVSQGQQSSNARQITSVETEYFIDSTGTLDSALIINELELDNVSYGYRLGINPLNNILNHPDATNPITSSDNINLTMRSGLKLTKTLSTKLTFSFGQSHTLTNKTQGEIVKTNLDYLPSGKFFGEPEEIETSLGDQGFPFPAFNLRYSGLKDIEWLKKYITSASLDMNYSGKKNINEQMGIVDNNSYNVSFSPLIGLSVSGKKPINGSVNYTVSKKINNKISDAISMTSTQTFNQVLNASLSYSHKGGFNINLPMMEDKHLDNNIDFRLEISYTNEQVYIGNKDSDGIEFSKDKFTTAINARPSIQYSFTDKVSGNVSYDYRITDNRSTGRTDVGDFQFGVNIQIKG